MEQEEILKPRRLRLSGQKHVAAVYSLVIDISKVVIIRIVRAFACSAYKKSLKLMFTPGFRTALLLSKYLNFKWFVVLSGREIVSQK